MRQCKSKIEEKNGSRYVTFDEETKLDMAQIIVKSNSIFSKPFGEQESMTLLDTIIEMQLAYSDDIADLEDVLSATVGFLELLECRLSGGGLCE